MTPEQQTELKTSMAEATKTFTDRVTAIDAEEKEFGYADPEKREMLEAMKKGFYDDMHRRMEQFFAHSHKVEV